MNYARNLKKKKKDNSEAQPLTVYKKKDKQKEADAYSVALKTW